MTVIINGTTGITTPADNFTGSTAPANGMYLPTTNTLGLVTNSTERMRIDSSGRVTTPYQTCFSGGTNQGGNLTSGSIPFGDIIFNNVGSCWNSSTNRFTAPIAGRYKVVISCRSSQAAAAISADIRTNGTTRYSFYLNASGGTPAGCHSFIFSLSVGDYIDTNITSGALGGGADTATLTVELIG